MKKWLFPLLLTLSACGADTPQQSKTLSALKDFEIPAGVGLYKDKDRQALAINAANPDVRNKMLGASHSIDWLNASANYDITFHYMSEKDGEPRYEFWINDNLVRSTTAVETDLEFEGQVTDWDAITLSPRDVLTIKSNAVTNGKIPEGDGTAYARGRWNKLDLKPTR
jgi:hypothetical protein